MFADDVGWRQTIHPPGSRIVEDGDAVDVDGVNAFVNGVEDVDEPILLCIPTRIHA